MASPRPIRFHRHKLSGHCHRVELLMSMLGLAYQPVDVDMAAGAHKRPDYLALNPFGQVPAIEDGEIVLADSNAILVYLALAHGDERWLPRAPLAAAEVQRWLSVAAGELAYGPAAARRALVFGARLDLAEAQARAQALFAVMDRHLATRAFLAADHPTIADLALFSYTAHAPEGGVALSPYPHIEAWIARIEALPGFVPMPRSQPRPQAA